MTVASGAEIRHQAITKICDVMKNVYVTSYSRKKVVGALTRMGFIAIVTLYECWIGWLQETILLRDIN